MGELVKKWNDGGSLFVSYDGDKDGSAIFSSDIAEGKDRTMFVYFIDKDNTVSIEKIVKQSGKRQAFSCSDGGFILRDGGTFNVIKDGLQ